MRGGSVSTGHTTRFRLRDEDTKIIEPSTTKSAKRATKKWNGKEKGSAQKNQSAQTEDRQSTETSDEQTKEQPTELSHVNDDEEPTLEPSTTKSPKRRAETG